MGICIVLHTEQTNLIILIIVDLLRILRINTLYMHIDI